MVDLLLRLSWVPVLAIFLHASGGRVDGYLFPVASSFEIDRAEPAENGYTRIWGSFNIQRPGCDFAGLDWFLVGVSRDVIADVVFEEGTKERPGGGQEFGPWLVQLSGEQIFQRSKAVAYHKCPWRWWRTETELWP